MIDEAIAELAPVIGVKVACSAVGESPARHYRRHHKSAALPRPERAPASQLRALSNTERAELRVTLNTEDHPDEALATVDARLLDKGLYLGSISTMCPQP